MAHQLSKVYCTNSFCPALEEVTRGKIPASALRIPRELALKDGTGHYWCQRCKMRCDLMNWGSEHHWPELHFGAIDEKDPNRRYAVGNLEEVWVMACCVGTELYIRAMHAYVFQQEQPS